MNILTKTCTCFLAFSFYAFPVSSKINNLEQPITAPTVKPLTKNEASSVNSWLLGESNTERRWKKVQTYLRGFDQPMLETGQRYQAIHQAVADSNYELAVYHWKKIRTTIENGYMKRPKREKNAKLLLLDSVWQQVLADFNSKRADRAKQGLATAKAACMSCHIAEDKGFINDQPMFRLSQVINTNR